MLPRGPALSLLAFALFAGVFAGCLETPEPDAGTAPAPALDPKAKLLSVLEGLPEFKFDRMKAVNGWDNFVTAYSYREWGTPQNLAAAAALESELKAAGFKTETLKFQRTAGGASAPGDFLVVRGLKEGIGNASHRLALISHYDTVPQTAQGAYDDGSGTWLQLEICKLLAKVPTNKTIECDFFDGEEQGLVASQAYTADYAKGGKAYVIDQGFGYDMTGLNWPGYSTWDLYAMVGTQHPDLAEFTAPHQEFLNVTLYDFLETKAPGSREGITTLPVHDRNSDEQNFKRAGIPVIRFAGGRKPGDYPMYHQPADTTLYVYTFACACQDLAKGKEAMSKGMEMVVMTSYYTILAFDQYDPKAIPL